MHFLPEIFEFKFQNAHLMVIGSKDMEVANVFVNLVVTQTKIVAKMILLIKKIPISTHFVCHVFTIVRQTQKDAIRASFHQFKEMETGDALRSRMARAQLNMLVSSWYVTYFNGEIERFQ